MRIVDGGAAFVSEKMAAPFGFKGKYVNDIWQVACYLEEEGGAQSYGVGVQSVVWSDASVFEKLGACGGNSAMFLMTRHAVNLLRDMRFDTPAEALDQLLPRVLDYGRQITGNPKLRMTFALNALVAVDFALWQMYVRLNGLGGFDDMLPAQMKEALCCRQRKIAGIPLITYGLTLEQVKRLYEDGAFFLKIKIGSDPDKDGDPEKMLAWDMERMTQLHGLLKDCSTPYTANGKVAYYLDANGRYDSKERLMRLVRHLEHIGALEQVALLEEPFPEGSGIDVGDIPLRVAADESAHSVEDAVELMELGYSAMALKPIAKTLSMSLAVAAEAKRRGVPCFCADLTVNPLMVDWNKSVAARLEPLPGLKIGVFESNGHQNYTDWERLSSYHPMAGAGWTRQSGGVFDLDDAFYANSGGVFQDSRYYIELAHS